MPQRIVIWGASGHALVVADVVRAAGNREIVGFLDDVNPQRRGSEFSGATILGGAEQLPSLAVRGVQMIVAVGDCAARLRLAELARAHGVVLATAVHPRAVITGGVSLGPGTVVCAGAVVNPGSRIGSNVIINTSASIDHECVIEDGAHVGPGAHLGGRVTVGRGAWIGIGATVRDRMTVGAGTLIGAGAVVVDDIPGGVVAYGVPARVIRQISADASEAPSL